MRRLEKTILFFVVQLLFSLHVIASDLPQSPQPITIDPDHAYSLVELIDVAESSHPDTRIAWANARSAELILEGTQSAWMPRLSAAVMAGEMTSQGQSGAYGVKIGGDATSSGNLAALSLQWLLFDFGERQSQREAAQQVAKAAAAGLNAAIKRVMEAVTLSWYANASARAHVDSAQQALQNANEIQIAAVERQAHGIGTVIEVAQARDAVAQAKLALVQARGVEQDAKQALINSLGIAPFSALQVASIQQQPLPQGIAGGIQQIVNDALERRSDVQAAAAMQQAAAAQVRVAQATYAPKVFFSAQAGYLEGGFGGGTIPPIGPALPNINFVGNHQVTSTVLGVTVPLFDGFTRNRAVQEAQLSVSRADASFEQVRNLAVRQIIGARNALETSLAAHAAAQSLMEASQITYDAALDAYRQGVGSVTDVTLAQSRLLLARQSFSDAYLNVLSAAATLAFATCTSS